jgi:hypothetical protein
LIQLTEPLSVVAPANENDLASFSGDPRRRGRKKLIAVEHHPQGNVGTNKLSLSAQSSGGFQKRFCLFPLVPVLGIEHAADAK